MAHDFLKQYFVTLCAFSVLKAQKLRLYLSFSKFLSRSFSLIHYLTKLYTALEAMVSSAAFASTVDTALLPATSGGIDCTPLVNCRMRYTLNFRMYNDMLDYKHTYGECLLYSKER